MILSHAEVEVSVRELARRHTSDEDIERHVARLLQHDREARPQEGWTEAGERVAFERLLEAISNAYDSDCDTENVETEVAVAALVLRDVARQFHKPA